MSRPAEDVAAPDDAAATPTTAGAARVPWARATAVVGVLVVAVALAYLQSGSGIVVSQAVVTGILVGGVYGLVAMGLTLIFGVLDIVNFAHGAFLALALFGTYWLVTALGLHPLVALAGNIVAMFVLGALVQRGVLAGAMDRPLENQLLITLGLAMIIENGLLLFFGADPRSVALPGDRGVAILGAVADLSRILAFAGALVLAGALFLLLQRTRLGTAIRAVAASSTGAELVGIDTRRIYVLTFAIGTACAGAAGTLLAPLVTIEPTTGAQFTIIAFVVVVLGGMGNVVGALVSGLVIGLAEQLGGLLLPGQSPLLAVFIVFVLVLFLRPQGLFGRSG
ncbi:MAG TPA: branched-chain amino acid ABC transporter permease [Pseudonocardia sp.]|jgi:branched-chain amino acid transport system permease protein|uniref:branched-chain amino acid ABC transporter permease n=1 Tax=Pseudonocardia sp. TaxID=60912 RepID=UPI002B4ABB2C|nr:branched-chain amino acid ABC transporter permease [Pseudonocardia sp.]HLU55665.1 branched-chain amino acid ABC transporter permease [Pseudonocardia sp.]